MEGIVSNEVESDIRQADVSGEGVGNADAPAVDEVGNADATEPDVFPREYVEKLRKENADARVKAKRADELAQRLQVALVAADGRLADPHDLPFNADYLDDADLLAQAIGELVATRPGLKAQQVRGDVGAGARGSKQPPKPDLIQIMQGMM